MMRKFQIGIIFVFALTLVFCSQPSQKLTPSNVKYEDLKTGSGQPAVENKDQALEIQYDVWVNDGGKKGAKVATTREGVGPFIFLLGRQHVNKGLDEGIRGMKAGGVRRIYVSQELAQTPNVMQTPIPSNSDLIYDVELVKFRKVMIDLSENPAEAKERSERLNK